MPAMCIAFTIAFALQGAIWARELILAMIAYSLPLLTGRNLHNHPAATFSFWASNIGMTAMTLAFGVAAIVEPSVSNMGYISTVLTAEQRAKAGPKNGKPMMWSQCTCDTKT